MVRGKGVPQHVRLPVREAGFTVKAGTASSPVRRADAFIPGVPDALQDACQGREDGDVPGTTGLAVVRGDADDAVVESYVAPAQPFHFIRAHARVEHDGGAARQVPPTKVSAVCINRPISSLFRMLMRFSSSLFGSTLRTGFSAHQPRLHAVEKTPLRMSLALFRCLGVSKA